MRNILLSFIGIGVGALLLMISEYGNINWLDTVGGWILVISVISLLAAVLTAAGGKGIRG